MLFKCNNTRSVSHKPKEGCLNCNIPRSISPLLKEARFKCNIPHSISHIQKQARFKCNIPRSMSHKSQDRQTVFLTIWTVLGHKYSLTVRYFIDISGKTFQFAGSTSYIYRYVNLMSGRGNSNTFGKSPSLPPENVAGFNFPGCEATSPPPSSPPP